ncbi:DUF5916 domain-containing protein [Aliikangiella sp. IMCC44653]
MRLLKLFVVFGMLVVSSAAFAQSSSAKQNYSLPRVVGAPTIDGFIQDDEWAEATQVELKYNINPGDSTPAPVKTYAYMMEDGENLYIAFKAFDPEPEKIRAYIRDQDAIFQDDFVGVILDTFNDERKGFEFFVNPMGSQGDLTRDDTLNNEDSSWNTVWDSAGQLSKDGYMVEMAIPFRALRFNSKLSEQTWGIQFLRIYPRDSRMTLADNPTDRNLQCTLCQVNKVTGMKGLKSEGYNLEVTPTVTYVNQKVREVNPVGAWEQTSDEPEFGVDARWGLTENWIVNGTINPDFSQVEADDVQLDINRTFSLFYREARPFFLDGADYFDSQNRLVHTRNIADPDYGLKLTGKQNGHSLGVIAANDQSTSFLLPSSLGSGLAVLEDTASDIFVARSQHDFDNQNNLGVLVTHRSATDYKNSVVAVDGKYYFTEKDILSYQLMQSDSENPESIQFDDDNQRVLDPTQSDLAYTIGYRHNDQNYVIRANYNDYGKDFRADMGFVPQVDYRKLILGGEYIWYGEKDSKWTRLSLFGDWDKTLDQSGKMLEQETELHMNVRGPLQFISNFGVVSRKRYYDEQYFNEDGVMVYFELKPLTSLTIGNFSRFGDQVDFANSQLGKIKVFEPYVRWQIGKHMSANISYTNHLLKVNGEKLFRAELSDIKLAYQFSVRSRLSLTLQGVNVHRNTPMYNRNQDTDPDNDVSARKKRFGTKLIYSYKINPRSLVYVGYSDNAVESDEVQSLTTTDKTVFAKFSYMWQY